MWANGCPQQPGEATILDEPGSSGSEDGDDDDDEELFDVTGDQFNTKLIEMDSIAKKLAEKFPRDFGAAYLTTLAHSNARHDFTPAIQVTASPVTALRFGDRGVNNRGKKPAAQISKGEDARSNCRVAMNKAAKSLLKNQDRLVETVDEVNNRPAKRKYKQPLTSARATAQPIDLHLLENEIENLETTLCAKYRLRASMMASVGDVSSTTTDAVNIPTQAITLVVGPKHYYDTTTMFQFTNNIPDNCPLPEMFRALYTVREDDVPQTREQAKTKKRERHVVSSVDELVKRKDSVRNARVASN